jgi:hypothetical protein
MHALRINITEWLLKAHLSAIAHKLGDDFSLELTECSLSNGYCTAEHG